jgi:hypothetical protein
LPW